jgi:hypothetical protein
LIDSENGVSRTVLVLILIILFLLTVFVDGLVAEFLYVGFVSVRIIIVANNSGIGRDDLTILDNDLEEAAVSRFSDMLCDPNGLAARRDLQCHQEPIHEPRFQPLDRHEQQWT